MVQRPTYKVSLTWLEKIENKCILSISFTSRDTLEGTLNDLSELLKKQKHQRLIYLNRIFQISHVDECESPRTSSLVVVHDLEVIDWSVALESLSKITLLCIKTQSERLQDNDWFEGVPKTKRIMIEILTRAADLIIFSTS